MDGAGGWAERDFLSEFFFSNWGAAVQVLDARLRLHNVDDHVCDVELDDLLVLVDFGGWRGGWREVVERAFSYGAMGTMALLGRMLGLKAVNREYTPKHLMGTWESEKPNGKVE